MKTELTVEEITFRIKQIDRERAKLLRLRKAVRTVERAAKKVK